MVPLWNRQTVSLIVTRGAKICPFDRIQHASFIPRLSQSQVFLYQWVSVLIKGLIMVGRESYSNKTLVICCLVQGHPESAAWGTSPPNNKSEGRCCHNSWLTVINSNYNMTKHVCIKLIYDKIPSKSLLNQATLPTCLLSDITHPWS